MNFIEFESAQKLRGGYYTQSDIATFLTKWVLEAKPKSILEPSCGDGAFFDAIAALPHASVKSVVGHELDPCEAAKACRRASLIKGASSTVCVGDFLKWFLALPSVDPQFDAVLGNPPFVRYQYLEPDQQALAERIFDRFHLHFTKHTNAWVPFIIASLALLRPGGRLAMVVPSELLHVLHAKPLRDFILSQCSKAMVADPEHIWFSDTLQGVVLLMAEKRERGDRSVAKIAIKSIPNRTHLSRPATSQFSASDYFSSSILNGKWMVGLLNKRERDLLAEIEGQSKARRFKDVASVDVGLVTGANKFFLVTDEVVDRFGLHQWAHPMFGKSDHVQGVVYDEKSHRENKKLGFPTNFLWFDGVSYDQLPEGAKRYIRTGVAQGLPSRYKCRIREPWYCVPSVYLAPVGMLKRSHHFPRLVLNTAKAYTTDTAYRVKMKKGKAADFVASFVNSLTALSSELEGRHYGGGVLELVPSEIEKVLIPVGQYEPNALSALDASIRSCMSAEALLAQQDELVLKPLGIGSSERKSLLAAWLRLRGRRQRTGAAELSETDDAQ